MPACRTCLYLLRPVCVACRLSHTGMSRCPVLDVGELLGHSLERNPHHGAPSLPHDDVFRPVALFDRYRSLEPLSACPSCATLGGTCPKYRRSRTSSQWVRCWASAAGRGRAVRTATTRVVSARRESAAGCTSRLSPSWRTVGCSACTSRSSVSGAGRPALSAAGQGLLVAATHIFQQTGAQGVSISRVELGTPLTHRELGPG